MKADSKRIAGRLNILSKFTSVTGQITRRTYTKAYEDAVEYLNNEMKQVGLITRMDGIGTLIGTYNPLNLKTRPIGIGSHIDTVANGGAYDGAMGIIAGIELIQCISENNITLEKPIEIIAFAEEEGGVFGKGCLGSEYMTGNTSLDILEKLLSIEGNKTLKELADGVTFKKAAYPEDYGWAQDYYDTFYEVHVEQGKFLETAGKKLGIVQGVVGIMRNRIIFNGQSNHAGTTRMHDRLDASIAMAELVLEAHRLAHELSEHIVITCGKIDIFPNQHNVVPGKASMMIEMRGDNDEIVQNTLQTLQAQTQRIAEKHSLALEIGPSIFTPVKLFDSNTIASLETATQGERDVIPIFSWAGHDAKIMGSIVPSAMLFVPSRKGLSHCPEEFSDKNDIAIAVNTLLKTIK